MISDRKLKIVSFVVALAGICIIYLVSIFTGHNIMEIGSISEDDVGKYIVINGTIDSVNTNNGNLFIEIHDRTGKINTVVFERTAHDIGTGFKENDMVMVEG